MLYNKRIRFQGEENKKTGGHLMRKTARKQFLALALVLAMLAGLGVPAMAAEEEVKTITILQTSDLHGMVNPFDYASNKENKTSMADRKSVV